MIELPPIDAWVERPDDVEAWQRFVGNEAWSPLALALAALEKRQEIRRILVEGDDALPEPCRGFSKVRRIPHSTLDDIPMREAARRLAAFGAPTTCHGLNFLTEFCTFGNPHRALAACEAGSADDTAPLLLIVGAHTAALTDQALEIVLAQAERRGFLDPAYFAEGPRGMFPILWNLNGLRDCAAHNLSPAFFFQRISGVRGNVLGPAPSTVKRARLSFSLAEPAGRTLANATAKALGERLNSASLEDWINQARGMPESVRGTMPLDLDIEVTPKRPFLASWLPNPSDGKAEMRVEGFERILDQIPPEQGVVLTLGGFGDALLHPEIERLISIARPHVRGLAIKTFALDVARFQSLAALGVDIVQWRLGIWQGDWAGFNGVTDGTRFDDFAAPLVEIAKLQEGEAIRRPMLIPEVVKSFAGDKTLLDFYTFCRESGLHMQVTPLARFAGTLSSDQATTPIAGERPSCLRLESQMTVLADGLVPPCTQLAAIGESIGSAFETSLSELWQSVALSNMLAAHRSQRPADAHPACADCSEWCRLS
ncbi:MAG: SPASM domain-containing protein [Planctomycetes bacterium]|nr:SPASM domain-containing protein [Planctomycetota bacterium]